MWMRGDAVLKHDTVAEVLEHGRTGYIVDSQDEAVAAARRVDEIDRSACRRSFEARFTAPTMARRYLEVYARLGQQAVLAEVA